MKLATLTALALIATSGAALAHDVGAIDATQARQRHRIEHGRYAGELTRREYRALMAEQAEIAAMERRAKADGWISPREFRAIRAAQREAGRNIYEETHDGQVNPWRRWRHHH